MRGAVTKEETIQIGDALEALSSINAWALYAKFVTDKADSIQRGNDCIVNDLNKLNYDNGRRRGLKDALSIVEQAIKNKNAALKEDAAGG